MRAFVYEVDWEGELTGFQWHAADHVDEMGFDAQARKAIHTAPRYVPERGSGGWLHINSISTLGKNRWYDETGDARFHPRDIILDSREANFIAIIHRDSGKIVWRVGPDFGIGTREHRLGQMVGQHHAHMIPHGLPGAGNILVFDNGGQSGYGGPGGYPKYTRAYSRVLEFDPLTLRKVWEYGEASYPTYFFSFFISSAQRLPNGNTLISDGANGVLFEVTRSRQIVWRYVSTSVNDDNKNYVYRAYRVPPSGCPPGPTPAATLHGARPTPRPGSGNDINKKAG